MDCPVDGRELLISERAGVEIDYCPKCRGVWLDRGELDKILDRASSDYGRAPTRESRERTATARRDDRGETRNQGRKPHKKSKGLGDFIDDIFDF